MTKLMKAQGRAAGMTVEALSGALRAGKLSAREAALSCLARMEECEPQVGAFLSVTREKALAQADAADAARARGEAMGPLSGIPMALKDNICTRGVATTCASGILEGFIPTYDAHVVERLARAGAVLLGKLNMDEFAMGSTTESSFYQATRNPADLSRVPGGSSGGSAAAVAAREAPFALGSDTGGSIRQPAAFCGVVGMKPTYGLVSRYGLVAFASSLDQIGPLARTVRDCALVLGAIAGHDRRDATSARRGQEDYLDGAGAGVRGLRAALPREYFGEGVSAPVRRAVEAAARRFESLGARVEEVSLPSLRDALDAYYVISSAEAYSNLARFDGVRHVPRGGEAGGVGRLYASSRPEGFGSEARRRVLFGTFVLGAGHYADYYEKALRVRTLIRRDFERVFAGFDFILSPAALTTAYPIGGKTSEQAGMYHGDYCTAPVNMAGLPALSIPCGEDEDGLPVGLQLIGKPFGEKELVRAAYAFESDFGGGGGQDEASGL